MKKQTPLQKTRFTPAAPKPLSTRCRPEALLKVAAKSLFAAALLATALPHAADAAEGGIGRPITGMQILPLGGILPTEKGWIVSLSSIYYEGSIEGSKSVPVGGSITGGLDYHISYNLLSGIYVWGESGRWTFGSSASLPIQYTDIKTSFGGPLHSGGSQDTSTQFADMLFSPIMADYHFSQSSHMLFGLQVFAPTGSYNVNRLANAGQNNWTFIPNVAYTTILPEYNIELTGVAALEFYTRNDATDYRNGTIARFDGLAIKRFNNGLGAGVSGGWIQQISDDKSTLADRLDGFRGRSLGLGPIVSYEKKIGTTHVSTSLRWIHEFNVRNRPEGDGGQLSVTVQF